MLVTVVLLCAAVCVRSVMVQRLVCWLHTTPTLLVLVKIMAANITRQQVRTAVMRV